MLSIIKNGNLKVELKEVDKLKSDGQDLVYAAIEPVKEAVDEIKNISIEQGKMILVLSSAVDALVKDAGARKDNEESNKRILNNLEMTLKQIKNEVRQLRHRIERAQGGNDL